MPTTMAELALRSLREYCDIPLVTTRPGSEAAATTWPRHLLDVCAWCTGRRIVVLAGGQHAAVLRDGTHGLLQVTWLQDATTWIVLTAEEAVADDAALALADELAAQARPS